MTPQPCPVCKGRCCRDYYLYRVVHMGAEHYQHDCDDCCDGIKYPAQRTYEQGIAEGERQATARIVAWLREKQERVEFALTAAGYEHAADAIERGEHVGWSKRETP